MRVYIIINQPVGVCNNLRKKDKLYDLCRNIIWERILLAGEIIHCRDCFISGGRETWGGRFVKRRKKCQNIRVGSVACVESVFCFDTSFKYMIIS